MHNSRQLFITLLLSITAWVGLSQFAFTADDLNRKEVLILYGLQSHMPIVLDWDRNIRNAIESEMTEPVRIESEFLDLLRSQDKDYRDQWMALLRRKYPAKSPDVVIAVFDPALRFVLDHRNEIFPNVPVVFCSASSTGLKPDLPSKNVTGVAYDLDYLKTFELAKRLLPSTKKIAVVAGTSDVANSMLTETRRTFAGHPDVEVNYLTGRSVEQLLDEVSTLPDDTIILFLVYVRDPQGQHHYANDVLAEISKRASVPTFAMWDTMMGAGAVGGCMVRIGEQGRLAGEMAVRVMHGNAPASIPITGRETNKVIVDWRELRRWKLNERNLLHETMVLYRKESLWQKYGLQFLFILGVMLIQSALITGLLINSAKRRRAERCLSQSREESRDLAGKLITAQEDERRRIAREMHDDLSQRLAAAANETGSIVTLVGIPEPARVVADHIREELVTLADDVHRISRQLHPSILDDLGLEDALRSECQSLAERRDVRVDFDCRHVPRSIPKSIALCVYRVAQEALQNAVKHAGTDRISVTLMSDDEFLYLKVEDHGHGFEKAETASKPGLGLQSIRERVRLVDGQVNINTQPGSGTTIEIRIPHSES